MVWLMILTPDNVDITLTQQEMVYVIYPKLHHLLLIQPQTTKLILIMKLLMVIRTPIMAILQLTPGMTQMVVSLEMEIITLSYQLAFF